jgi:CRP-like cAMP-binding protein
MAKRVVPGTTVPIPKLDLDDEPTPVRDGARDRDDEDELTLPRDLPLGVRARPPTQSMLVSPFFAPLPADQRGAVLARFAKQSVAAGATVIRQGETAPPLVIVTRGRLDIRVERATGQLVQVGSIATGEYIGEAALLSRTPASAHVVASTDAELLALPPRDFDDIVGMFPALRAELEDTARRRMRDQDRRLRAR